MLENVNELIFLNVVDIYFKNATIGNFYDEMKNLDKN